jgi:hypothetical protein
MISKHLQFNIKNELINRGIIGTTAILVTCQAFEKNIDWAKVVFIVIATLFNPLIPIYLSRNTWILLIL